MPNSLSRSPPPPNFLPLLSPPPLTLAEGQPLTETLNFRASVPFPDRGTLARDAIRLDFDVFISVDAGWRNYYHWLCLCVPKMIMGQHVQCPPFRTVIPEYLGRKEFGWPIAYSETVWDQSIYMAGLDFVLRLPPGLYTSRRIHSIMVDNQQPALLSCFREFFTSFDIIRQKLRANSTLPKRIFVQRGDGERVPSEEFGLIVGAARNQGFVSVYLEDLDFVSQAELFFNAEAVIAASPSREAQMKSIV